LVAEVITINLNLYLVSVFVHLNCCCMSEKLVMSYNIRLPS
jgi:hypothetical protein